VSPPVFAALAFVVGYLCGILNLYLLTGAARRLVESGRGRAFVLSSFARLLVFGTVAVAFAAKGPWWSLGLYIVGLFTPFALRVIGSAGDSQTKR